ncbi:MAG TPA: YqaJ viral recombinase family protein [Ramlibacter sp.]|nr:YqaJ viral recombinase family protein [Ramlibacter sp.]
MKMDSTMLAERRRRIGSSDVAAVLGKNRFKAPIDVWRRIVLGEEDPIDEDGPAHWGNVLEPVIRAEFLRRQVEAGTAPEFLIEPGRTFFGRHEWEVAHLDAELPGDPRGIGEIKTDADYPKDEGYRWGRPETDEVPEDYLIQVQWQLMVAAESDPTFGYARVLLLQRGCLFCEYVIHPHLELQGILREQMSRFWRDHVLTQHPPTPRDSEEARRLFHESAQTSVILSADAMTALDDLRVLKERAEALELEIERRKYAIQLELRESESGLDPKTQRIAVRWKTQEQRRLDTALVKAQHPQLYLQCGKLSKSRPFTVAKEFT